MAYTSSIGFHIMVGSVAILFYWTALLAAKGGTRHRAAGRLFFTTLLVVALSVGPMLFLRPGAFDPAHGIQFVYLALCLVTVSMLGWTAIRWKTDVERFRGPHFRVLGIVILVLGLVVLAAGIAGGRVLTMLFSWVGIVYGGAMIRFAWMRSDPQPRWWLAWHLNAVAGLFNAAHGTFLAVAWRSLADPQAGDALSVAFQLATIAAGLALRAWFGRRRDIPRRFTAPQAASSPPASMPGR